MDDDIRQFSVPGAAWEAAKQALAKGDIEKAEGLLKFMLPSDQGLMQQKIDAAKAARDR